MWEKEDLDENEVLNKLYYVYMMASGALQSSQSPSQKWSKRKRAQKEKKIAEAALG